MCSREEEKCERKAGNTETREKRKLYRDSKGKEKIGEETSGASSGLSRRWPVSFNSPPQPARNQDWLKTWIFCPSDILQLSVSQWDYPTDFHTVMVAVIWLVSHQPVTLIGHRWCYLRLQLISSTVGWGTKICGRICKTWGCGYTGQFWRKKCV